MIAKSIFLESSFRVKRGVLGTVLTHDYKFKRDLPEDIKIKTPQEHYHDVANDTSERRGATLGSPFLCSLLILAST